MTCKIGMMAALTCTGIAPVTLADAVNRIRTVPKDGELVMTARALGISFGDTFETVMFAATDTAY